MTLDLNIIVTHNLEVIKMLVFWFIEDMFSEVLHEGSLVAALDDADLGLLAVLVRGVDEHLEGAHGLHHGEVGVVHAAQPPLAHLRAQLLVSPPPFALNKKTEKSKLPPASDLVHTNLLHDVMKPVA